MEKFSIIKSISKIKIHPLFFIVCFLCFITGYFQKFFIFTCLLFIHELGHILSGKLFSWKIKKILLLPFGGITIFEVPLNIPIKQEFIVSISGVLYQNIGFFLLSCFFSYDKIISIHLFLMIFNLLPIYPLDGSKIIKCFLEKIFPFKLSHLFMLSISFFTSLIILIYTKSLSFFIILLFLIKKEIEELQKHSFYFHKFLLERYLSDIPYDKIIHIKSIKKMKKECYHYINYKSEKNFLKKYFRNE